MGTPLPEVPEVLLENGKTVDHYRALGVTRCASGLHIRRAFHRLAAVLHPDRNGENPAALLRYQRASAAYDVLSKEDERTRYDAHCARVKARARRSNGRSRRRSSSPRRRSGWSRSSSPRPPRRRPASRSRSPRRPPPRGPPSDPARPGRLHPAIASAMANVLDAITGQPEDSAAIVSSWRQEYERDPELNYHLQFLSSGGAGYPEFQRRMAAWRAGRANRARSRNSPRRRRSASRVRRRSPPPRMRTRTRSPPWHARSPERRRDGGARPAGKRSMEERFRQFSTSPRRPPPPRRPSRFDSRSRSPTGPRGGNTPPISSRFTRWHDEQQGGRGHTGPGAGPSSAPSAAFEKTTLDVSSLQYRPPEGRAASPEVEPVPASVPLRTSRPPTSSPTDPGDGKGPLPQGWGWRWCDRTDRMYFLNHGDRTTSWDDPRDSWD
eukprot:TRINITY_DN36609_c0_g1_i1.p1 TRINITY_DN36609_c0_g1~~TRINITY_DN36609_c0_g1_i1.p1  ORF type:complete len:437 (+),score=45.78 TRINITY_DN36609_c0_g1_i1:62-1372(+)